MYEIQLHNNQSDIEVDEVLLREIARQVLREEGIGSADISIAVVDDATIHRLNRQFLNHDYPTDVLSFPLDDSPLNDDSPPNKAAEEGASAVGGRHLEGEVILSAQTAARRAAEFHWSPFEELVLYLVHGLLHLTGHDDKTPAQRREMRNREELVLSHLRRGLPQAFPAGSSAAGITEPHNPADEPSQGETT